MNLAWSGVAIASGIAILTTAWSYIQTAIGMLRSKVIVTVEAFGELDNAVTQYCTQNMVASKFGPHTYFGSMAFVRRFRRQHLVVAEDIGITGRLFWKGWRPLWIARRPRYDNQRSISPLESDLSASLSVIRGTFDLEKLLVDAADDYSASLQSNIKSRRHFVRHVSGTAGVSVLAMREASGSASNGPAGTQSVTERLKCARMLKYSRDELMEFESATASLDSMAFGSDAQEAIREAVRWKDSEKWYRDRGCSWRMNWMLSGPPGSGKTSTARGLSEAFDMPIFVYDLATLRNKELRDGWAEMLSHSPVFALIEDADSVFNGRTNIVKDGSLTFGCLLNVLDGVQRSDGVFLIVTTNHPEKLDPALHAGGEAKASRPGRIDRHIILGPLTESGRRKLAERILCGMEEYEIAQAIADGDGETGAQFQERCRAIALNHFWNQSRAEKVS